MILLYTVGSKLSRSLCFKNQSFDKPYLDSKKGQQGAMNGVPGGQQQQPPGMPDPINALQNLASQGKIVDQYTRT